jgi:3-isopropylmalate/(R)-2-methylmalate dehydratase small subunit
MNPFTILESTAVLLPINDIDTDQIIPARFLKVVDKTGLGENLFSDWRYLANGLPNPNFVLNKPENKDAKILVAGDNFGCGSSREHAPWALQGCGFRAVISTRFADIFRNNALKNGLLPVTIDTDSYESLVRSLEADPQAIMKIDLPNQILTFSDGKQVNFPIGEFSKTCLVKGIDELGYLLGLDEQISIFEESIDYI